MFQKIHSICHEILGKLVNSFKRFPESLIAAVVMIGISIYRHPLDINVSLNFIYFLDRMIMILVLGIPAFLIVRLWFERAPNLKPWLKALLYLGVLGGLITYFCFGLKDFEMVSLSRYFAITMAVNLIWLIIPYFYKRQNFELYSVRILSNLTIAYFYAVVLYIGVLAIVYTIDSLFTMTWREEVYFDLWLIVAGFFAPAYFLAEMPLHQDEFQVEDYPKVLKILFLYIIIPLIIIYAAILYAYFAKIIILGRWPQGIVSHLVLWYGLICSMVFFFLHPLRTTIKWLDKLLRIFPIVLLLLLLMMFVAMGIRVQAYGLTESRYFVLITGTWLTVWMLYNSLKRKTNNLLLPLSLAIIAFLSVSGPWSAYSVSRLNQYHRFVTILKKYDMIRDNQIVKPKRPIAKEERDKIVSVLEYFRENHSLDDLKLLPANFEMGQIEQVFGFDQEKDKENSFLGYFCYRNPDVSHFYDIRDFDYYCLNKFPSRDSVQLDESKKLTIECNSDWNLEIKLRDKVVYRI